jgi:hypothetical protein
MSWFSRILNKQEPSGQSIHRVAFATPDGAGPEAEGVHLVDYVTFDSRATGQPAPLGGSVAIMHFDFLSVFPAVSWASETGYDTEYPAGFSYKVMSARHEPSGDFECVVVRQVSDGSKTILRRFMVPKDQFSMVEELVRHYEELFSIRFNRREFLQARTPEDFNRLITGGQPPPLAPRQPPRLYEHSGHDIDGGQPPPLPPRQPPPLL